LLEPECIGSGYNGIYQGDGTTCDVIPCGACCYWHEVVAGTEYERRCVVTGPDDCIDPERWNEFELEGWEGDPPELQDIGARWSHPGALCGNPNGSDADTHWWCEDPRGNPTPTEETSWGKLKTQYR
jgi:hypothetical protein